MKTLLVDIGLPKSLSVSQDSKTKADQALNVWRTQTLNHVLLLMLILGSGALFFSITNALQRNEMSFLIWLYPLVYSLALGLTFYRRGGLLVRGWGMLLLAYTNALVSSLRLGLTGSGRLYLMWSPIMAVILLGGRSGLVAAGLSLALYLALMLLNYLGLAQQWLVIHNNPESLQFWMEAGSAFAMLMISVVVLLERFRHLQETTLTEKQSAILALAQANTSLASSNQRLEEQVAQRTEKLTRALQEAKRDHNRLEGQVRERTAELISSHDHLQMLNRLKDECIANISHELRTPIANQKLYLHLLTLKPEKQNTYLSVLHRETRRLERIIEDLLYFSQLTANNEVLDINSIDLNAFIRQYVKDRMQLAQEKEVTLLLTPNPCLPMVLANDALLERVVSVLLNNALNYTPPGGLIAIHTQVKHDNEQCWSGFAVSDTGPGFSPDELPFLFDRFFRGKAAQESAISGIGLGLAIAREIVNKHQGCIEAASDGIAGYGATFTVWLPAEDTE